MNYELIALVVVTILLLLAGGYITKLVREIKEFFDTLHSALEDGEITPDELARIISEAKDIKNVLFEIAKAIQRRV